MTAKEISEVFAALARGEKLERKLPSIGHWQPATMTAARDYCDAIAKGIEYRVAPKLEPKVKSCPFCGGGPVTSVHGDEIRIECDMCQIGQLRKHDRDTSVEAWNRRAVPRVKLEWRRDEVEEERYLAKAAGFVFDVELYNGKYLAQVFRGQTCTRLSGSYGLATADEAKAACEQWAQKLAEELCK